MTRSISRRGLGIVTVLACAVQLSGCGPVGGMPSDAEIIEILRMDSTGFQMVAADLQANPDLKSIRLDAGGTTTDPATIAPKRSARIVAFMREHDIRSIQSSGDEAWFLIKATGLMVSGQAKMLVFAENGPKEKFSGGFVADTDRALAQGRITAYRNLGSGWYIRNSR